MNRLVSYSLSVAPHEPRPDITRQLVLSLRSLRAHSPDIPVVLFVHGELPGDAARACAEAGVHVHPQGPYERRLAALCPAGWPALAAYPLLHRFFNFAELAATRASQVLLCDCDTIFMDDVAVLFDRYGGADLVAREEVHSTRSHHGADPRFIDEALLGRLAAATGAARIAPFNLGLILLNGGVWRRLAGLDRLLADYAWRFATWMALHPANGDAASYGEFAGAAEARRRAGPADLARALPYPSANRWILDEVSLWLALGHVPGLRTADFDPRDVVQNGEFAAGEPADPGFVACHYYSQNLGRIERWLARRPVPAGH